MGVFRNHTMPEIVYPRDSPYSEDRRLFKELGLRSVRLPHWKERYVGQAIFTSGAWLKIWLICGPAPFWRCQIHCPESKRTYALNTGSGALSEYWPVLKPLLTGMLVVTACAEGNAAPSRRLTRRPIDLANVARDETVFW